MQLSVVFIMNGVLLVGGLDDIHEKLRYFETLNTVNIVSRRRRRADGKEADSKQASFHAFGREFHLVLYPGAPVLAPDFQAKTEDESGQTTPFHVDPSQFFLGHLAENESVPVEAHFEDGVFSSSIAFHNDTYVVEPGWRHLPGQENRSMIVYRASDVKNGERDMVCRGIRPGKEALGGGGGGGGGGVSSDSDHVTPPLSSKQRQKRSTGAKKDCSLLLVADYAFFKEVGKSVSGTANFLLGLITRLTPRFQRTVWEEGLTGFGFQVKEVIVHTSFTRVRGHYNEEKYSWDAISKIEAFNARWGMSEVCLAHLYTSHAFPDNTAGIAYMASSRMYVPGGICSTGNTGLTTSKNNKGRYLTLRIELINTHELGHNWGAEHDASEECTPSDHDGGKYYMWPYAVNGWYENNHHFSPCSKNWIAPVLKTKAPLCFTNKVIGFCGNGLMEEGEECDGGALTNTDSCCTPECKLRVGAQCSDSNDACCWQCQVAPADHVCHPANHLVCKNASYCDGQNFKTCPPPGPAVDDIPCKQGGKCKEGKCVTFCNHYGTMRKVVMEHCMCEQNITAACRYCCKTTDPGAECQPTDVPLPKGSYCGTGYCQKGVCERVETITVKRMFHYISSLGLSDLVRFMRANIVMTVMIVSAVLWVPASKVISHHDSELMDIVLGGESRHGHPLAYVPTAEEEGRKLKLSGRDTRVRFEENVQVATSPSDDAAATVHPGTSRAERNSIVSAEEYNILPAITVKMPQSLDEADNIMPQSTEEVEETA